MHKFDREKQKALLQVLFDSYPEGPKDRARISEIFPETDQLFANALYLEEHGLMSAKVQYYFGGIDMQTDLMRITAKGIDFIQQDGGLGAILNVQTIKFHRDAVVVLEDLIAISGMNDAEKEKAKSKLSELTTESLKAVVQTVTTAGLAVLMK